MIILQTPNVKQILPGQVTQNFYVLMHADVYTQHIFNILYACVMDFCRLAEYQFFLWQFCNYLLGQQCVCVRVRKVYILAYYYGYFCFAAVVEKGCKGKGSELQLGFFSTIWEKIWEEDFGMYVFSEMQYGLWGICGGVFQCCALLSVPSSQVLCGEIILLLH
eukprot:TRINITY_DN4963_c0_g1_i6.p4 TRINITY_DN4963_c0_g1~~TRINITY_DN4963_c0_g1_i6.p4  ORF type:complete len:163 (-),score=16.24 TRINITY_DN4963_c0_g1_i6:138-626(-)